MSEGLRTIRGPVLSVVRNTASLLTSDVLNKATTFVVYALVARYTDTRAFGQLSLGLLLLYTFQVFACVGLPTLITRDLSLAREQTSKYFATSGFVVLCSSVVSALAMLLFSEVMAYPSDTKAVLSILALGLVPQALATVTEAVFRAWERMHYIAYANVPFNLLKVLLAYWLLESGYGVAAIAMMLVAIRVAIVLVEWGFFAAMVGRLDAGVDFQCARRLLTGGSTFLGIDGLLAIWNSLDVVLISKFCGEEDVGLFSAACQLMVPARLFFHSVVSSVFPIMCQKVKADMANLAGFVQWLIEFLMTIGLPIAVGLFFLAGPSLLLLYGDPSFVAAAGMVEILVAALFFQTMTTVLGHALWAGRHEVTTLRIVAVNVVVNLVIGWALVSQFGVIGAAVTALLMSLVNCGQHYLAAARFIGPIPVLRTAWKAAVGAAAMALCFLIVHPAGPVIAGISAGLTYVAVMGVLLVRTAGGFDELRSDYFAPLVN